MSGDTERLALGCVLAGFAGREAPDWLLRRLDEGLGGVVLFAPNVRDRAQVTVLAASLRRVRPEVVIAIDEEGGDVTRLEVATGSSYPGNLALGVLDDVDLTEQVAGALARGLAGVGVTTNFAPVADVNTNPDNPVIGVRAFGSDPEVVARHVAAFVRGTQAQGVAACAKHFPGHGDTAVDSHLDLPTVEGDLEAALVPFRAAVDAGVRSVMSAHLVVPALDPETPATLSRAVLTDLLRGELRFDGMTVTDALEMRAIAGRMGMGEAAVRAVAAGADAICLGRDVDDSHVLEVRDALVAAVRAGRLALDRLADAARRVTASRVAATPTPAPDREVGEAVARRAVRARGDVTVGTAPLVVELAAAPSVAAGAVGYGFPHAVRARWGDVETSAASSVEAARAAVALANGRRPVVVLRDAGRHAWQREAALAVLAERPDAIIVETGLPTWRPPDGAASIETLGAARVNLDAAVALLAG
jgi:beta-N-acetylhexosaminidase